MKRRILGVLFLTCFAVFMLAGCSKKVKVNVSSDTLYVKKVDNLPKDFIMGMDASSVLAEEASGVKYYNFNGEEQDIFKTFAENGITHIRVRVWNNPYDENGNGYGGGNCDINTAIEIGKRASSYGMKLIVDFHYSDFWADPSKQMVPLAWKDMDTKTKANALYEYTKDCLTKLKKAGVDVGIVQIGNEINGSLCGETKWLYMQELLTAGSKAIREVLPKAQIAVHFANPEKSSNYESYANKLKYYEIDYDIFASSYYPYWHGTLDNLKEVLSGIAEKYNKKVMVMETSYAYTNEDSDFSSNTISMGGGITTNYPFTVQGQANCVRDVIETVANTKNGIGVVYWEGAWITVGGESYEENFEKWEKYGSGWASSYAGTYDPKDAGKYYGGSAVDNQTLFDKDGKPLESLKVFGLVGKGNTPEIRIDALENVTCIFDLNGEIKLPSKVNAVMSDDSKKETEVEWDINENDYLKMYSDGPKAYDIIGHAGDLSVHCYVSMVEYNFLKDYSFEEDDNSAWKLTDLKKADELYIESKETDSLTGKKHAHFWSSATDSVEITVEQTVNDLKAGTYKFTMSIMGGDAGETDIYIYARVNGETVGTAPLSITSYGNWCTNVIPSFKVNEGDSVTVGMYVKCQGSGNGAWGKIDDALLNSVSEND